MKKKTITTALLAALLASTAVEAFAQEDDGRRERPRREHAGGSPEQGRAPEPQYQAPPKQVAPTPERRPYGPGGAGARIQRDDRPAYQPPPAPPAPQAPQARPAPRPPEADRRNDDRRSNDNRRWRDPRWNDGRPPYDRDRPRYDRRYYPPVYRIPHRYRIAPYRPPPGWYSFRWSFGDVLPHGWYGPQYRIWDWWAYGLPMPPIGYEWFRVGDDALLVDTFTGRVVQVVYNLFW